MVLLNNEKILQILIKNKIPIIFLILFITSFSYILFFTQCVPFFFDDHDIHSSYVNQGYKSKFLQLINLNHSNSLSGPRPVYSLFFITIFPFLGFDYCAYRIAKAIVFSFLVFVLYSISHFLFKKEWSAIATTIVIMTSFPLFIQTFGYNGTHIFAELFKDLAILFFIRDIINNKSSIFRTILIFVFALLAIRSYDPSYSIAAILPLFTLFYKPRKFPKYIPLFLFIILIQFPLGISFETIAQPNGPTYTPKLINIKHVFTDGIIEHITSPFPNYSNLYYKPAIAILTFFGFWLLIISIIGILLWKLYFHTFTKKIIHTQQKDEAPLDSKMIITLTLVWMLSELPTYIFLPEHAIRYLFTFLVPFVLLAAYFVVSFLNLLTLNYKKYAVRIVYLFIIGIVLTNISYTYAFRAGWGSAFIAFENVMDFMANEKSKTDQTIGVLYNAGSAADEYFYLNKSSENYSFGIGMSYIKTADLNAFTEENIRKMRERYNQFYVLKRTTSISGTEYPPISFNDYDSLQETFVIYGYSEEILFDKINRVVMRVLGVTYKPNQVVIYKYTNIPNQIKD